MTPAGAQRLAHWITPCLLAALTFALFSPVRQFAFVEYDDPIYVTENPGLHAGLSRESLARAFTEPDGFNWIPLTLISFQIDHAVFGLDPAGYHLTNAGLHAVSTALLYAALLALSGSPAPSLFVAAAFAVHPLHVESVAWVSERKDVLSGLFWMLTLLAYAGYARSPRSVARYALVVAAFAAGLMAKPMLVTLPLVLLLLDHWPLGRTRREPGTDGSARPLTRLVVEKIPLLAMSAAVGVVTIRVQRAAGAVADEQQMDLLVRIANACESYWIYIADTFWPRGLSVFYPHPGSAISPWTAAGAAAALIAVTGVCIRMARSRPYLFVGWFWYAITLLPVIGIVQAGMQARADRYTYLPQTGLAIALAWFARDAFGSSSRGRAGLAVAGSLAIVGLSLVTWNQLPHWRDSVALYEHAIAVTENNFVAHHGLGAELFAAGDYVGAERHYGRAAAIKPRWPEAHLGLGDALLAQGRRDMAIGSYRRGVGLAPRRPVGHVHLAEALAEDGQLDRAIEHYQAALQRYGEQPVPEVHARYGAVLARKNQLTKAANQYRHALASKPDYAEARANLGFVLIRAGEYEAARAHLELAARLSGDSAEIDAGLASAAMHLGDSETAVRHYTAALRLRPQWAPAAINLAWILATHPDPTIRAPARAVAILEELPPAAIEATPVSLDTLAAAYAATGRFEAAVTAAEAAAALARERGRTPLAARIEARRADYADRNAFIDSSLLPAPRS